LAGSLLTVSLSSYHVKCIYEYWTFYHRDSLGSWSTWPDSYKLKSRHPWRIWSPLPFAVSFRHSSPWLCLGNSCLRSAGWESPWLLGAHASILGSATKSRWQYQSINSKNAQPTKRTPSWWSDFDGVSKSWDFSCREVSAGLLNKSYLNIYVVNVFK
jgi:hypothetical protein